MGIIKKSFKGCLILFTIGLFALIALSITGVCIHKSQQYKKQKLREKYLKMRPSSVKWETLSHYYGMGTNHTDLQKNEHWKYYKGKKIEWKGKVAAVTQIANHYQISIFMSSETLLIPDVYLYIAQEEKDYVLQLREGDTLYFQGILEEWGTTLPFTVKYGKLLSW